jgi:hypothetical protein
VVEDESITTKGETAIALIGIITTKEEIVVIVTIITERDLIIPPILPSLITTGRDILPRTQIALLLPNTQEVRV